MVETTPAPLLAVEHVSKAFGPVQAVTDASLSVSPGELFALLGASGSGKTTLLRLIAGLEKTDAGTIAIDGRNMADVPAYARPVNTVFQSYALFPHMNVRANVAFGLKQDRIGRDAVAQRVDEMLALVQMKDLAQRRPHQLSGGQKQRIALARSLAKLPKLLLLDEPLAALDRKLREQMRLELAAIQRRVGITFILVTHDQEEAMSLADRIAVMDAGRIIQVGAPRDIYERPNTRFVADFVGKTNLFEGKVIGRDGPILTIRPSDQAEDLRAPNVDAAKEGDTVWVAVRPEKLRFRTVPDAGENFRRGHVRRVEYLGDASLVYVETGTGISMRVSLPHRVDTATPVEGGPVTVAWAPQSGVVLRE
ncbi:MAG: ABC transporter ATP-binding protein [Methylocystis sp.]